MTAVRRIFISFSFVILSVILTNIEIGRAQDSPEDHEKHHPPPSASSQDMPAKALPSAGGMGGAGGMGEMMKGMMEGMGASQKKEFYPSLMSLPTLTEQAHSDLEVKGFERMRSGAAIMNQAIVDLTNAAEADDYARMKEASGNLRDGLGQFESGIAIHDALAEGKSPQDIGLSWFKNNLSLEDGREGKNSHTTFFGLSLFHIFVMVLLSIFSFAMVAMYFFKMKRATKLLSWLENGAKPDDKAKLDTVPKAASPTAQPPLPIPASSTKTAASTLWKGKLKVATVSEETPTLKTFKLVSPEGGELPFTYLAGQFLTLSVVIDGKPIKRAYTVASHPCDKKMLEITIKREENGLVSRYMHDVLHEGDLIDIEAASGKLTFSGVTGEGIVLIGGGVGITPLMSVLRCLISCGMKNEIHLLYACKSLEEFVYHEELRLLQSRNSNLKLLVAVDKLEGRFPGAYEGRLTKEKILEAVPNIKDFRVHICGPPKMMEAIKAILAEVEVPKDQIKEEAFGSGKPPAPKSPAAAAAPNGSPPAANEGDLKKVTFKKAGKTVSIKDGETVLELSESSGIEIPFQCRVGTCGICKIKLISGNVTMEVQDALTEEDKQEKVILACQAKARSDLEVEEP